jgi:hypothetical protein
MLALSVLPFGFALWFARLVRETFTGWLTRIAPMESVSLSERMKS